MNFILSASLFGLLLLSSSGPREDSAFQVFATLEQRASAVVGLFNENDEKGELAKSINIAATSLMGRWKKVQDFPVPDPYLKTLRVDIEVLDHVIANPNAENTLEDLRYVFADLELKNIHARSIVGAAPSLGAIVRVTVKTIKGGKPVSGYSVRCNPKRFADLDPAMFVFNNETNPTTVSSLPPGNYEMWVEMPVGQKLRSKPVSIGGDGGFTTLITFEVPE